MSRRAVAPAGASTYVCAVRARTSGGTQDASTDTVEVTTDATGPTAPAVSTTVV